MSICLTQGRLTKSYCCGVVFSANLPNFLEICRTRETQNMQLDTIVFFITIVNLTYFTSEACKGCINLDEYNFEKVISRFKAVLVKFDVAYPYGDKHETFSKVAIDVVNSPDLILAQVGIKDYGEKENEGFSKQYGIESKDDLPTLKLFVTGKSEPIDFPEDLTWTVDNIKKLVRDNTNIYIGLPGCLAKLDKIAEGFSGASNQEAKLEEAKTEISKLTNEEEKEIATNYIKFMQKIMQYGSKFIKQELARLGKLLDGKISKKKREELSYRSNILRSFSTLRDEL